MSTPILATKLYIPPPRPNFVARPRLIERLNEGLHRKLTLISAPAGFGKTTLVSEWIHHSAELGVRNAEWSRIPHSAFPTPHSVAWLSLDEGDSNLVRFLTYLVAALQTVVPQIGKGVLGLLQSPQPPAPEVVLTTLLNEIADSAENMILVLDDYHLLDATPIDQALTFLVEHLPPQWRLVIASREDPALPLVRLRARGQLTEVRAADLRFTPAEAADFLNQTMGLHLSAQAISALESRTEGWITGLQMAALSLQGRSETTGFIDAFTGSHRFVLDYLIEEVLLQQPEAVRSFLLQTAILDRLHGALCAAVTGQPDSQELLVSMERSNLFVVPLDDQRQWYRYHHLFAEVLQAHLLKEQPTQTSTLHQRASDWYEQNNLRPAAIHHALAAKDFARAAGLIELAWPAMDGSFQSSTWLGWAKALPDELVRTRPVLCVAYAWAFLNAGDLEAAESRLCDAERWLATVAEEMAQPSPIVVDEVQFRNLPASIATARTYQAQARGDVPGSVKYGQQALDLLPAGDHLRRGPAAALLGLAHWALGDLESAHRAIADAMANFRRAGNLHFALSGTFGLADIRTTQGRLHEAIETYTQALQLALAQGEPLLRGTTDLYLGVSELYREQGDAETASQHLRRSQELGEQAALPDWYYRFCRVQARFKQSEGDLAGAIEWLDEAERHFRPTPLPDVRPLAAAKARVWVAQGKLSNALRWVHERGLSVADNLSYLHEFEHITLARVLIVRHKREQVDGSLHAAIGLLARLLTAAETGGRMGSVIEILLLQSLAHEAQEDIPSALVALERALMLAEPEGYVRLFVDEGAPMALLLSTAATHGITPDYTARLLAAFPNVGATSSTQSKIHNRSTEAHERLKSKMVEPLSERELEVLRLLGSELSGPEMARQLMVSLNTLRTHTKNIFSKLGVNNRRAAVRRAKDLDIAPEHPRQF